MALQDDLARQFPNLFKEKNLLTSPPTPIYNCIAWAYGTDKTRLWPNKSPEFTWPPKIPNKLDTNSFIKLFESIGYSICDNEELEVGFLKVAIFTSNNLPTHAARQLLNGLWTSKLGPSVDISHTIKGLNGGFYGDAEIYLKRPVD
jgi:hypothetical protein